MFNSAANELDDNHLSATERMLKLENASRNRKVAKVPNSKTIVTSVVSIGVGSGFLMKPKNRIKPGFQG